MSAPLLAFLAVLAAFNAFVSARILGTRGLSGSRKAAQIAIVWLLPAVGAVVCMSMAATLDRRAVGSDGVYVDDPSGFDGGLYGGTPAGASCETGGDAGGCDGGGDGGGGGD